MSSTKYSLTEEHRAQLKPWADKWIKTIMSTSPMDDADRTAMIRAINGLYAAANLELPRHIVFVPSPRVLAFAGGFAAAIWHMTANGNKSSAEEAVRYAAIVATWEATMNATWAAIRETTEEAARAAIRAATEVATAVATRNATKDATQDATWAATLKATAVATRNATEAATENATRDATMRATWGATEAATRNAIQNATKIATREDTMNATMNATAVATRDATANAAWDATRVATEEVTAASKFMLLCAKQHYRMWNGGNQWGQYVSYLTFFKDIVGLDLPQYDQFNHYVDACVHGGPRIMHDKFCMVSDRPEFIRVDDENRPHCDFGPFCRWRDGWSLYYIHGVKVDRLIVERPDLITAQMINDEENAEIRRIMLDRFGWDRYLLEDGGQEICADEWGTIFRKEIPEDETLHMVEVIDSTPEPDGERKKYLLRFDPSAYNGDASKYPQAAIASTWRNKDGSLALKDWRAYEPLQQT